MLREKLQANDRIGPYRVVDVLGRGGMGVVYRAEDPRGEAVALKTVFSERAHHVASIRLEISTLARIRHPGVVRVLDHGLHDGAPWYAMELLEGQTLRDIIRRDDAPAPLPLGEALRLAHRVCEPLAFLHGEGVVHRDLKPSNVFLRDGREPVLVDFGLVQRFGGTGRRETLQEGEQPPAGTYLYMSPEQLAEGVLDPRADIYALGCLLYEMVVGRPPFRGNVLQLTVKHLQEDPTPASARVEGVPRELDDLLASMLQKRPTDRAGYAADVATRLERVAAAIGAPLQAGAPGPTPRDYLYRPDVAGRERELREVERAIDDPATTLVLLHGPSGVGKTRVATELAKRVRLAGRRVAKGSCEPLAGARRGAGGAPLHGLRGVLREVGDVCRGAGEATTRRVFGPRVAVLAMFEPSLEDLVPREATAPAWLPTTEASRRRLHTWLAETLTAYAREQGLVVFVDDVQWADEVSLGFLRAVAERSVPTTGLTVVCTCRDESPSIEALTTPRGGLDVRVGPLGPGAAASLIGDMLGHAVVPRELTERVMERTAGNPLHLSEFLHAAVARGVLRRDAEGVWRLRDEAGALAAPQTIGELAALRIDAYGQVARQLLELFSAAGTSASTDLLADASELGELDVLEIAGELIAQGVLEEDEQGALRFAHAALRESVYARIERPRRRALHRRVAEALEARGGADPAALATHWDRAGEPGRAAPRYLEAAMRAQRQTASARAYELFERGFALEQETGRAPDDDLDRRRLELAYGAALSGTGRLEQAERVLKRTLEALGAALPTRRAGWAAHSLRQLFGHVSGLRRGPAGPDETDLALEALELLNAILMARADTLGQVATALTAGNLAASARRGDASAVGHARMAVLAGLAGMESLSERYLSQARDASAGQPVPPRVYASEALVHLARGRWHRLEALVEPAVQACQTAGDFQSEVQIRLYAVGAAVVRGRPVDCARQLEPALALAESHGYAIERVHLLGNRAAGLVLAGDTRAARDALDAHAASLVSGEDPVATTLARVLDAAVTLMERPSRARPAADAARAALASVPRGSPGYVVHHLFLPAVYLGLAERGDRTALGPARALTDALARQGRAQPAARPVATLFRAIAERLAGRPDDAARTLDEAEDGAARLGLDWAAGVAAFERARAGRASSDEARRRLSAIGAAHPPYLYARPGES